MIDSLQLDNAMQSATKLPLMSFKNYNWCKYVLKLLFYCTPSHLSLIFRFPICKERERENRLE